jgi:hypothetical protein
MRCRNVALLSGQAVICIIVFDRIMDRETGPEMWNESFSSLLDLA